MNTTKASRLLGALAHKDRLAILRMLGKVHSDGLSAGTMSKRLKISPSALTFHLQALEGAQLIAHRRAGPYVIYTADLTVVSGLVAYLLGLSR